MRILKNPVKGRVWEERIEKAGENKSSNWEHKWEPLKAQDVDIESLQPCSMPACIQSHEKNGKLMEGGRDGKENERGERWWRKSSQLFFLRKEKTFLWHVTNKSKPRRNREKKGGMHGWMRGDKMESASQRRASALRREMTRTAGNWLLSLYVWLTGGGGGWRTEAKPNK